ncbi:MAG: GntG family PLP-dependent aldolase [Salibacteraceae bacterium]
MIDLRSDTVTKPTAAMLEKMFSARVGDDVFGDDPTVNELQDKVAEMFGMEAALFCPSGTMTNQVAIKAHTQPGDEVICHKWSHVYLYEGGGISFNSACSVRLIGDDRGKFSANDIEEVINRDDPHHPVSKLVVVENTCNRAGGTIWSEAELTEVSECARSRGLHIHLDGARLFNAVVESSIGLKQFGKWFDSISICLSKGLGCPVGSLLIGDQKLIHQARRIRKVLGGGMRQAGYLAAAGIYAFDNHITRLKDDHARAKDLASVLASCNWVKHVDVPETNIVVAHLADPGFDAVGKLKQLGLLCVPFGSGRVRFTLHLDIDGDKLNKARQIIESL